MGALLLLLLATYAFGIGRWLCLAAAVFGLVTGRPMLAGICLIGAAACQGCLKTIIEFDPPHSSPL